MRLIGRTFIAAGITILLFLAYQLFGTNIITGRDQKALRSKFVAEAAEPPTATVTPDLGEGIALLRIPKIGLDRVVVEGVGVEDLKKGPGHYPGTAMPGHKGNAVISGHRTTYGAPFYRLDELVPGDDIEVTDLSGTYHYKVSEQTVVPPTATKVLDETPDDRLTLTTCNPRFSARQRLIIVALLVGESKEAKVRGYERAA
ncbi:MAG: class E sortase [Actinobacteria bacterium]|nr:class E sortase [Actinomycetota bacterium]